MARFTRTIRGSKNMQYMLMIYEDERVYGPEKSGLALAEMGRKQRALRDELGSVWVGGAGLAAAALATTVRTENGSQTIHDGPFAESKEQLGGYHLIDVADLDEAIAIAKRVPLSENGAIEIRPVITG